MNPASSNEIQYMPGDPPSDPAQLQRYLREEMNKIAATVALLAEGFDPVIYKAPPKPRKGMRRYADGTSWNPGSGAGLYSFNGTTWVLIKAL